MTFRNILSYKVYTIPPYPVRLAVVVVCLVVYTIVSALIYAHFHSMIFPLFIFPLMLAGWGFGVKGAAAIGLGSVPVHFLVLYLAGVPPAMLVTWDRVAGGIIAAMLGGVIGYLFDVHRQLRLELAHREELQRSEQEERVFAESLHRMSRALNETLDTNRILDQVLAGLVDVAPYDAAQILLSEVDRMTVVRQSGDCLPDTEALVSHIFTPVEDMRAQVIDSAELRAFPGQDAAACCQCCMIAPVQGDGVITGYLALYSHVAGAFQPIHAQRLQTVANHVAVTIRNAKMYNALESAVVELNTLYQATSFILTANTMVEIGQQIAQAVVLYFDQTDCGVMLLESDTGEITRLARAGQYRVETDSVLTLKGPGLVAEAIRQEQIVYVPDVTTDPRYVCNAPLTRSEMVVPLKGPTGVLGALDLQSPNIDSFNSRDQRILTAFADRAAIAIDNMRLHSTLREFALDREEQVIERTAELNRAKERVEIILNSSSDTIILTLPDGRIEQSNLAFYNIFNYDVDEEFDWPLTNLVSEKSKAALEEALEEVREGKRPRRLEVVAVCKDGFTFDADLVLSPIVERHSGGQVKGIVCSLRDISEHKRMEQELREALAKERELLELKTRFVSMASHEFRTPLATILATSNLLSNYIDRMDEAKKQHQFRKIQEQIQYMTGLMDDVLSISRMEAGKTSVSPEPLLLHDFAEDIAEEFEQTQAGYRLEVQISGEPYAMPLDPKLMRKIINNLLSNAAKYSPAGSTVYLNLEYQPEGVTFSVRDEGIGIPENDQARLFEAFHRAENVGTTPGTGLGLSIVKNAVDLHHGQISFVSRVNEGTTFTVSIPREEALEKGMAS